MKIGHIAIWTNKLEEMRTFYTSYFNGTSSEKYVNASKGFESYFIRFSGETTLELMRRKDIATKINGENLGICHIAFDMGSREKVLQLTELLHKEGNTIAGEPRITGDGFFESVILDVDGNRIELVAE